MINPTDLNGYYDNKIAFRVKNSNKISLIIRTIIDGAKVATNFIVTHNQEPEYHTPVFKDAVEVYNNLLSKF